MLGTAWPGKHWTLASGLEYQAPATLTVPAQVNLSIVLESIDAQTWPFNVGVSGQYIEALEVNGISWHQLLASATDNVDTDYSWQGNFYIPVNTPLVVTLPVGYGGMYNNLTISGTYSTKGP